MTDGMVLQKVAVHSTVCGVRLDVQDSATMQALGPRR